VSRDEKQELIQFISQKCKPHIKIGENGIFFGWPTADVKMAIQEFESESTEGETCDTETTTVELQKELEYWKGEARARHDDIIRMVAIIRTIEQITGKNFID
jgi:hypothetical protein